MIEKNRQVFNVVYIAVYILVVMNDECSQLFNVGRGAFEGKNEKFIIFTGNFPEKMNECVELN